MSFLFRCCCRPFLKGGDDGSREFYKLLEIDQDASTEEIKRAYKRKSLALHPDKLAQRGQVLTPEDQARVRMYLGNCALVCRVVSWMFVW